MWNWFKEITLSNGNIVAKCQAEVTHEKICEKHFKTGGSTGNLISHLSNKHQILEETKKEKRVVIILLNIIYLNFFYKLINFCIIIYFRFKVQ